jgi:CDGSH-type Zn-finger protein
VHATITPTDNGPYLVHGPITLLDAEGRPFRVDDATIALCRCGHSSAKPFCDGSHETITFRAVNRADGVRLGQVESTVELGPALARSLAGYEDAASPTG